MDVNDLIQIRIEEAARKIAAARRRRAELDAARQAGLARRHAARLRHQAEHDTQTPMTMPTEDQAS